MKTILVVEDEMSISLVLKVYLEKANFKVVQAFNGKDAIDVFDNIKPDLVLLDVMLPDKNGLEILTYIREKSSCPVMMLTALGKLENKLTGLNSGADDYLTKPFVAEEVIARIHAVLRRSRQMIESEHILHFGTLKINFDSHSVSYDGMKLTFTPRDLSLLMFLAKNPNHTFSREQLIEKVWGIDFEGSDRAVDLAIKRIRKTLKVWPATEGEIKTIRGLGYQFCVYEE